MPPELSAIAPPTVHRKLLAGSGGKKNPSFRSASLRSFSAPTIAPSSEAKPRTRERPGIEGSKPYPAQKDLDRLPWDRPAGPLGDCVRSAPRESSISTPFPPRER